MGKKSSSATDPSQSDAATTTKREQPLQAVLLADDFCSSFQPISLEKPKVLCPLNNVPIIEYALEFLAGAAGVEEVFVVCVSDQVEEYLEQRKQLKLQSSNTSENPSSPSSVSSFTTMQVNIIKDTSITNAGDALREIDKRNLIQSDPFILMFGDTVTNAADSIVRAIAAHKQRKRKDSSAIMTLLMKQHVEAGTYNPHNLSSIRSCTDDLIVGIDPTQDNRLLVFDNHFSSSNVTVPCSFLAMHHPYLELRHDLIDCGIDICSPEVLARIADEFDYRDLRREFVANSVAEEEEGLQNKLHVHILSSGSTDNHLSDGHNYNSEYAARVLDFATYRHVSQDLLKRWCYPVVPENSGRYTLQRHYLYQECSTIQHFHHQMLPLHENGIQDLSKAKSAPSRSKRMTLIGRSSKVQGPGMIGSGCVIGENCRISGTILGHGCTVHDAVKITGSILWDETVVERGATVLHSLVADGAVIKAGAVIERGCIIGPGCVVGAGCVVSEFTRLTLAEETGGDDFDDDWDESESSEEDNDTHDELVKEDMGDPAAHTLHATIVGTDGKGRLWKPSSKDEDDEAFGADGSCFPLAELIKSQSIGYDPTHLFQERRLQLQDDDKDEFSEDEEEDAALAMGSAMEDSGDNDAVLFSDSAGPGTASSEPVIVGRQRGVDVIKELKLICLEYESSNRIENLAIELNSFKFSQNATYSDCTMAATLAILEKMKIYKGISDGKLVADFKLYLDQWAPLLRKMSIGLDEEKAIVLALEQCAIDDDTEMGQVLGTGASFRFLLQTLHDEEIVSEDAILAWAADRRASASSEDDADGTADKKKMEKALKVFQLQPVQDFLEWLEEESESESEEVGDGDDESE